VIITKLQVAPVELVVSSESSYVVRLAQHSQNAWARHVERVESCRVESRRAKWNLGYRTTSLSTTASNICNINEEYLYRHFTTSWVGQKCV